MLRAAFASLIAVACVMALSSCGLLAEKELSESTKNKLDAATFYKVPDPLPKGEPGTLIRSSKLAGAPAGADGYRIMYHSTDQDGNDIVVSGTVLVPTTTAPAAGRPIVAWAHPTTGAVARCAPSSGVLPFVLVEGARQLLAAGYVIASTDYPGLGVAGPSSYLLGVTEGNSVLDSARAATQIKGTDTSTDLLIWGHSQGGQAALFAAQLAPTYAPEFTLKAVAVAAPAADLTTLIDVDINKISGVTIGAYTFQAYVNAYKDRFPGLSLDSILTPAGVEATPKMADMCLLGQNSAIHDIAKPLIGAYVTANPATAEPWATILKENSAAQSPITVPMLIAQGGKDDLIDPSATAAFAAGLCAKGESVHYVAVPTATHGSIALDVAKPVTAWFQAVMAGGGGESTCAPVS